MADKKVTDKDTKNVSDVNQSNLSKSSKKDKSKKASAVVFFNNPAYIDGTSVPYRGRNMESFCRASENTK